MAENKFIKHLKGEQTAGSLVEIKNQNTPASFGNMPQGTSDSNVKYSDVRGDVTVVANGTTAWKLNNSALTLAPIVNGDGTDYISNYAVSGAGLWVNSTYTFPSTGDPNHPVAMIFNPNTKWVLKLCGDNLIVNDGNTLELTVIITIGSSNIISKQFSIREQANQFCKELVIDFDESNSALIKAMGLSTMQLQVLCGTADASARIYNGMTTLTVLQRKVDAAVVSGAFANVEEVLRDGILPSDYFNNAAYIAQIEDGETAYAVFQRDGDDVALSGWAQPIPDQTGNSGKFLTTDGSLMSWAQLTISDVDGLSTELSDLQDQIDDLSGRGRYLSIWNCTTGLAESNPPESPYTYQSGDYFIVGTVGATNYRPDGSSYTTGVASTTVETAEVKVDDVYIYDGTNWKLLASSQRTYTFAGIAGSPYDNTNLGNALDSKVNKNADITGATKCKITYDSKGLITAGADLAESDIPSLHLSKISDVTASASEVNVLDGITASTSELNVLDGITASTSELNVLDGITATTTELNYTDGVTSNIQTQLDAKQANLTAGTGIDIIGATISNSGVRSVSSGTANGTISVNTNGTSADVAVTGLGSAAYTNSSAYATAAQGTKADTAVQPGDLATVATTGDYDDLLNKPTIPTVNDATLTIQKNGTSVATFTANASTGVTANITVPTTTNDLTNNSGFITSSDIPVTDVTVGGTSVVSSGVAAVPAIPTVNNPTITITQGGVTKGSFTLNQATGDTIDLDAGGGSGSGYHPDLFDVKWADHILNDVQWLRADTFSWQSGAVYQVAYQHLADDIDGKTLQSETVDGTTIQFYLADDGHKICPASEETNVSAIYNATGVAWYYIIDTVNTRFKLPRSKHNKYAETLGVVGNGNPIVVNKGLTKTTLTGNDYNLYTQTDRNVDFVATNQSSTHVDGIGLTTDSTKSGIIAQQEQDTDQYKYLYFYVGNFTQTALENTAGITTEEMNNKVDKGHQVVEFQAPTAANNYTWYRKYADGWVEQGGLCSGTAESNSVSMPVEMSNTEYQVSAIPDPTDSVNSWGWVVVVRNSKTTTGFSLGCRYGSGSVVALRTHWEAKGMAA